MDHIAIYNYYDLFNYNNAIFNKSNYKLGDNLSYPFEVLRKILYESNWSLDTIDIYPLEYYEKVLFIDFPGIKNEFYNYCIEKSNIEMYLIIFEPPQIKPDNWDKRNHKYFKKIFTWNDDLVDNLKYFKIMVPQKIEKLSISTIYEKKLCTLISSNKINKIDRSELYSKRYEIIKWFEKHKKCEFDFYGFGWDKHIYNNKYERIIGIIKHLLHIYPRKFFNYKGEVDSKKETLSNYKFSICFENSQGKHMKGCITEKIFDSFSAGCVPIYLGCPNISDYIPINTFIDMRQFYSIDELYNHINSMSDIEYSKYINNINEFLCGEKANIFSAESFAAKMIKEIL